MVHQKILTHNFFRNNPRKLDEEKNKRELMMMIFDATPCLHENWKLSSLMGRHSMELFEINKERKQMHELFFLNYESGERKKITQRLTCSLFLCLLKRDLS